MDGKGIDFSRRIKSLNSEFAERVKSLYREYEAFMAEYLIYIGKRNGESVSWGLGMVQMDMDEVENEALDRFDQHESEARAGKEAEMMGIDPDSIEAGIVMDYGDDFSEWDSPATKMSRCAFNHCYFDMLKVYLSNRDMNEWNEMVFEHHEMGEYIETRNFIFTLSDTEKREVMLNVIDVRTHSREDLKKLDMPEIIPVMGPVRISDLHMLSMMDSLPGFFPYTPGLIIEKMLCKDETVAPFEGELEPFDAPVGNGTDDKDDKPF